MKQKQHKNMTFKSDRRALGWRTLLWGFICFNVILFEQESKAKSFLGFFAGCCILSWTNSCRSLLLRHLLPQADNETDLICLQPFVGKDFIISVCTETDKCDKDVVDTEVYGDIKTQLIIETKNRVYFSTCLDRTPSQIFLMFYFLSSLVIPNLLFFF